MLLILYYTCYYNTILFPISELSRLLITAAVCSKVGAHVDDTRKILLPTNVLFRFPLLDGVLLPRAFCFGVISVEDHAAHCQMAKKPQYIRNSNV